MDDELLDNTRKSLAEAVERASEAARTARLLAQSQERLAQAVLTEELLAQTEERLAVAESTVGKLRAELAETRYRAEVAQWKLDSAQTTRWSRLGDALSGNRRNPVKLAREIRKATKPAPRKPAPKKREVPVPAAPAHPAAAAPAVNRPIKYEVPKGPVARPQLTVAAIVDRHSEAIFRYEWRQVTNFGPENWRRMLDEHRPHLLFVESVQPGPRQGNGGRWLTGLSGESGALRDLLAACAERGIRTAFWQSAPGEPPQIAAEFEFRFTAYPEDDRDGALPLPFAVQPRVHNPVPLPGGRTESTLDLARLSYDDLLTAYRRLTALPGGVPARHAAEIAACGLDGLQSWRDSRSVTPLVDGMLDAVGLPHTRAGTTVCAVSVVDGPGRLDHLRAQLARQTLRPDSLVLLTRGLDRQVVAKTLDGLGIEVTVREAEPLATAGACLGRALALAEGDYVAVLDADDLYGEHHLADLVRVLGHTDAAVVGKAAHYVYVPGSDLTLLRHADAEHSPTPELSGGSLLARRTVLAELGFADLTHGWDEVLMRRCVADDIPVFAADRFSYVRVRDDVPDSARVEHHGRPETLARIGAAAD
ncbi:glycosyltransferase [Rhizohabitans arisaemae]|uniref:glycosyltransferase n=1 Tax=Rhizohabitans arisaemae TaxID=2720610 RepID=UPI0024B10DB8|nr:glycosyltransferase [Rhizohabitans arisaemae]